MQKSNIKACRERIEIIEKYLEGQWLKGIFYGQSHAFVPDWI
jgi:hypothetical protein